MKQILWFLLLFLMVGCNYNTERDADAKLAEQTKKAVNEGIRQNGLPNIVNFQEMKFLKMIYELCDREDVLCYAYLYNRNQGKVGQFLGRCVGYGIPYSLQYSNPERVVEGDKQLGRDYSGINYVMKLPQPEPNGLFKPEGLSATWLMLINPKTKNPHVVYVEPEIIVSPFKLH